MRCSVARLCERTVGRRVPLLGAGGGLLHTTPHCVVVTALGAELATFGSHTERRLVQSPARSWCDMESTTLFCGRGGSGRSTPAAGNGAEPRALRSAGVGGAGCLLRDESSALPMTAKLRLRRGGERRCRPERCHLLEVRSNHPTRFPSVRWFDDVATSSDPSFAIRPMLNAVPSSCLGKATLTSALDLRL